MTDLSNTLKRCFQILEAFSPSSPRLRLNELAAKTGLPKATVFRFLKSLTALNYVSYDSSSKMYCLSPRVLSLGYNVLSSMDLREVALPILQELSDRTGQNVNLGILDGYEIVYLERIKKRQILNIDLHVGSRLSAHNTSIGQVILAFMDENELRDKLKEIQKKYEGEDPDKEKTEKLYKKLMEIRSKGFAINDEEYVKGLRAIAAPIFNHSGKVEAGINIPVFASLVSLEELLNNYLPLLLEAAQKISSLRGYTKREGGTK